MAQKDQLVAAIDIGTTKIVALVGRINENNRLEVLGMSKTASKGVKRGVVLNIEETVNAIESTVTEAQKISGIKFRDVFVGIAGQHIKSVRTRGYINRDSYEDEITRDDIRRLVTDMYKIPTEIGEEIIHVLPQNYIVDSETGVKNPIGMSGKRLEANFHIVIGQIASAKNIEKCINRVNLNVKQLILEPLASSESVLTEDEIEAGVVLVDIGGGTTDVAVYYDDIIRHTAVIPFGGNVITRDIKEGCAILHRQAESLKVQFGSALGDLAQDDKVVTIPGISGREPKEISFKSLAYIIQSRMEEIIDAVMFEIENSGYMDKLSAGVVITGGGAMLRHLPQLVKFKTGMDVRIGYPNEKLASDKNDEINQPMYATSIGLLLKGAEYLSEKNEKMGILSNVESAVKQEEPVKEEKETKEKSLFGKTKILDKFRAAMSDIFDENDSTM
ncbi:MAG: cell division protein FtsA [Bacteroidales bacterium]|nr:cell division protein FtsA [Bacteroidales bacterium]MCB9012986.1 cell division protein FtsA [Bacteroidales bacterium]